VADFMQWNNKVTLWDVLFTISLNDWELGYNPSLIFFMPRTLIGIRKIRFVECLLRVVFLKLSLNIKCLGLFVEKHMEG
jgi:hypothetical protein